MAMGAAAVLLWSLMVGLMRLTTESFGPQLGAALVYALGTCMLFVVHKPTPLRQVPAAFLFGCGALFVSYEAMIALAIGLSGGGTNTIQVSMLNYLWPTLTTVVWALMSGAGWLGRLGKALPGAALAVVGMILTLGGEQLVAGTDLFGELTANPLPYAMALVGAFLWALFSNVASRVAQGCNATAYFFLAVSVVLAVLYLAAGAPAPPKPVSLGGIAAVLSCAVSMSAGYALWNRAAVTGDVGKLSIVSYCAPVLSSAMSALLLRTLPGPVFWLGVALVAAGSILGWLLVARRHQP